MWFLYIHFGIGIITLILFELIALEAKKEFKTKYPHLKIPRSSVISTVSAIFRLCLICVIPILNIVELFVFLFRGEEIIHRSIDKAYMTAKGIKPIKPDFTNHDGSHDYD